MSAARCSAAGHERCNRGGMCERDRGEQKCRTSFCTTEAYAVCISWKRPNLAFPTMQARGDFLH